MTILATIIVLGVLIFVHELGHFGAAKLVGIEVQRFSIGLGPRVLGFRKGETEYVLSAVPLGGYVKMGGMDDEVMERLEGGAAEGEEERKPGPRDFDSKPIWARAFVISAGVIMNMLFAFVAYATVLAAWGVPEMRTTRVGIVEERLLPPGTESLASVPPGARIERVGGRPVATWNEVQRLLAEAEPGPLRIEVLDAPMPAVEVRVPSDPEERRQMAGALGRWLDAGVGVLEPGSPADRAGLEPGDRIVAVDGVPVDGWWEFVAAVQSRPDVRTELLVERDGRELLRVVTPEATEEPDPVTGEERVIGKVGIYPAPGDVAHRPVSLLEAVRQGAVETGVVTVMIVDFLGDLVTGGVPARSVGSIFTIGAMSGEAAAQGADTFVRFMALFSINLAILNLLPIPVLDGGHLLFLAIEAVRGRALTVEQRLKWSNVGFIIVMGLMVWALSNDVMRLFGL